MGQQVEQSFEAQSSVIFGPGLEDLVITGAPDEHQLVWQVREPRREFDYWMVMVYNAGTSMVSDVLATLEYQTDGQWYLANMQASERLVTPPTILPGEFGFIEMGNVMASPPQWSDARIVVDSVSTGPSQQSVSLSFDVNIGSGSAAYSGQFLNSSLHTVENVRLVIGCAEDGQLTRTIVNFSDIIRLGPDESDPFAFSDANGRCDSAQQTIVTAVGEIIQ